MNYRLLLVSFILIFCLSHYSHAQIPSWSIRGGLNLATIGGKDSENSKFIAGTHFGVFGSLPITKEYSLESGLSYSLKGAKNNDDYSSGMFKLHYIDLPVLARFTVIPNLDFILGPQISILLASYSQLDFQGFPTIIDRSTENLRKVDLGIHLGTAYRFHDQISAGLGFDWGLLTNDNEGDIKTFNRVLKISIGYHFN